MRVKITAAQTWSLTGELILGRYGDREVATVQEHGDGDDVLKNIVPDAVLLEVGNRDSVAAEADQPIKFPVGA